MVKMFDDRRTGPGSLALISFALFILGFLPRQALAEPVAGVTTIAVIPVSEPSWFSLKNRNALAFLVTPLIEAGTAVDSRHKAGVFTEKIKGENFSFGQKLTDTIVQTLNEKGFHASVLQDIKRPAGDPDGIDYAAIKSDADAVLHVYFRDVGVESGYTTTSYLPKVNIYGYLFNPKDAEYIYDDTIYYGVDSREGKSWGVMADAGFAYGSFEELIQKAPEVAAGFNTGAQAAGKRLAENIRSALR
jgi:hypothetical protein